MKDKNVLAKEFLQRFISDIFSSKFNKFISFDSNKGLNIKSENSNALKYNI